MQIDNSELEKSEKRMREQANKDVNYSRSEEEAFGRQGQTDIRVKWRPLCARSAKLVETSLVHVAQERNINNVVAEKRRVTFKLWRLI